MNSLIPLSYVLNSTITVLQQGWNWYQITHEGWYAIKTKKKKAKSNQNTWNYTTTYKLFVLRVVASSFTCLQRIIICWKYLKLYNWVQIIIHFF